MYSAFRLFSKGYPALDRLPREVSPSPEVFKRHVGVVFRDTV